MWGKLFGTVLGFFLGGPLGAVLGLVIGHLRDSGAFVGWNALETSGARLWDSNDRPTRRLTSSEVSLEAITILGAKIAKSDGRVSEAEVRAFRHAFEIPDLLTKPVGALFDRARASVEGYEPYALRLAQLYIFDRIVLEVIVCGLFDVALADRGTLTQTQLYHLSRIATLFGFDDEDFMRLAALSGIRLSATHARQSFYGYGNTGGAHAHDWQRQHRGAAQASAQIPDPWQVLGLPPESDAKVIKRTYRALVRQYHPDQVAAQGGSAAQIDAATERLKQLNIAYAEVCRIKNIS